MHGSGIEGEWEEEDGRRIVLASSHAKNDERAQLSYEP